MLQKFFDLDELLDLTCFWFCKNSKRQNVLAEFAEFCDVEYHQILQHSGTRWLAYGRCVNRIIEIYPALVSYFQSEEGKSIINV